MKTFPHADDQKFNDGPVVRNVLLVLLGVAGLLAKSRYSGTRMELVHSYGGNVSASFAVYFILATPLSRLRIGRALQAVLSLSVVQLFEATDGFRIMSNTYDPADYLANVVGIVLAVLADAIVPGSPTAGPQP